MDLTTLTLKEAAEMIRQGELSPVALAEAYLERIGSMNPSLNAYITITPELALAQAAEAEKRQRGGKPTGILNGIPIALKDLYETQGVVTTAGSSFFAKNVPTQNAAAVERLYRAGAVLLGKTNMHEIALGVTTTSPHYGASLNPWDTRRITGGSSGGSAAALAARLCLGSLGSDTGGSIRIPSSLCGVVGLKPTYGRVSLRGVIPLSWTLDHAGPMARRVDDAAVLLQAVAGYDPLDPASVNQPVDDYLAGLGDGVRGWRIALAAGEFFEKADVEVLMAIREASKVLKELGTEVIEVEIPWLKQAAQNNGLITTAEAAAFHRERLEASPGGFGEDVLERLQSGRSFSAAEYILARRSQSEFRRLLEQFFENFDILLTPTTPMPAPLIAGQDAVERARQLTRFTAPFNLTGLPALSLPCGFSDEGLPIGLQMVAAPWQEKKVLQAGYAYETATEWHLRAVT